jgi:predicted nucleic acid-binding protein
MISVLFDTNIVLDVILGREPWYPQAAMIWNANRDGKISAWVSASSLPTIFYVVTKQADLQKAHLAVENCLRSLAIVPVNRQTLELAQGLVRSDFEDNLQIACAIEAKFDAIVTRDSRGFLESPIPVLSPAELIARLDTAAQGTSPTP